MSIKNLQDPVKEQDKLFEIATLTIYPNKWIRNEAFNFIKALLNKFKNDDYVIYF